MIKGGYQILDLRDRNFVIGAGSTINGAYETIEGTRKAILVSGIVIAGVEYHDTFAEFTVVGSNYTAQLYDKTITVTSADLVTISAGK